MSIEDYRRGVDSASEVYREVIAGYVVENDKLLKLVADMWKWTRGCETCDEHVPEGKYCLGYECKLYRRVIDGAKALGIEVEE